MSYLRSLIAKHFIKCSVCEKVFKTLFDSRILSVLFLIGCGCGALAFYTRRRRIRQSAPEEKAKIDQMAEEFPMSGTDKTNPVNENLEKMSKVFETGKVSADLYAEATSFALEIVKTFTGTQSEKSFSVSHPPTFFDTLKFQKVSTNLQCIESFDDTMAKKNNAVLKRTFTTSVTPTLQENSRVVETKNDSSTAITPEFEKVSKSKQVRIRQRISYSPERFQHNMQILRELKLMVPEENFTSSGSYVNISERRNQTTFQENSMTAESEKSSTSTTPELKKVSKSKSKQVRMRQRISYSPERFEQNMQMLKELKLMTSNKNFVLCESYVKIPARKNRSGDSFSETGLSLGSVDLMSSCENSSSECELLDAIDSSDDHKLAEVKTAIFPESSTSTTYSASVMSTFQESVLTAEPKKDSSTTTAPEPMEVFESKSKQVRIRQRIFYSPERFQQNMQMMKELKFFIPNKKFLPTQSYVNIPERKNWSGVSSLERESESLGAIDRFDDSNEEVEKKIFPESNYEQISATKESLTRSNIKPVKSIPEVEATTSSVQLTDSSTNEPEGSLTTKPDKLFSHPPNETILFTPITREVFVTQTKDSVYVSQATQTSSDIGMTENSCIVKSEEQYTISNFEGISVLLFVPINKEEFIIQTVSALKSGGKDREVSGTLEEVKTFIDVKKEENLSLVKVEKSSISSKCERIFASTSVKFLETLLFVPISREAFNTQTIRAPKVEEISAMEYDVGNSTNLKSENKFATMSTVSKPKERVKGTKVEKSTAFLEPQNILGEESLKTIENYDFLKVIQTGIFDTAFPGLEPKETTYTNILKTPESHEELTLGDSSTRHISRVLQSEKNLVDSQADDSATLKPDRSIVSETEGKNSVQETAKQSSALKVEESFTIKETETISSSLKPEENFTDVKPDTSTECKLEKSQIVPKFDPSECLRFSTVLNFKDSSSSLELDDIGVDPTSIHTDVSPSIVPIREKQAEDSLEKDDNETASALSKIRAKRSSTFFKIVDIDASTGLAARSEDTSTSSSGELASISADISSTQKHERLDNNISTSSQVSTTNMYSADFQVSDTGSVLTHVAAILEVVKSEQSKEDKNREDTIIPKCLSQLDDSLENVLLSSPSNVPKNSPLETNTRRMFPEP